MKKNKKISLLLVFTLCMSMFITNIGLKSVNADELLANNEIEVTVEENVDDMVYVNELGEVICSCGMKLEEHSANLNENAKALACDCGGSLVAKLLFTGNWYYTDVSKRCNHKPNGHDYEQKRQKITSYKCNRCSFYSELTTYDSQWICKGF